jgi:hypothetical protein
MGCIVLHCPNCNSQVPFEKGLFAGRHCKKCGVTMVISLFYGRVLMLLSFLAAEVLLWLVNIRQLFYPTLGVIFGFLVSISLGYPLAFVILTVLVRTAPRVVAPKLVSRDWGSFTTLDLFK